MKLEDLLEAPIKKSSQKNSSVKTEVQSYMFQTKEEIEAWMKQHYIKGMVSRELTIHVTDTRVTISRFGVKKEDILIQHNGKWVLPVQFYIVSKFDISGLSVGSFIGFPYVISEELKIADSVISDFTGVPKVCPKIDGDSLERMTSFSGLEETNCKSLYWNCKSGIDNLQGLPETLQELYLGINNSTVDIAEILAQCPKLYQLKIAAMEGSKIKNGLSSIFKHEPFKNPNTDIWLRSDHYTNAQNKEANEIINGHLHGDHNMSKCQTDLFKAGFKELCR
jgi:hypothetical protein